LKINQTEGGTCPKTEFIENAKKRPVINEIFWSLIILDKTFWN